MRVTSNFTLLTTLLAIVINSIIFYLFQSHNGFYFIPLTGLVLLILHSTNWVNNNIARILLITSFSILYLYPFYIYVFQDFIEWAHTPSILTASINLVLIFISIGLLIKGKTNSRFDSNNLNLCYLALTILGVYIFFTVLAQNNTDTNYNNYFVYFLLSGSFIFILRELIKQQSGRSNHNTNNTDSSDRAQQVILDNPEAIQEQIALFFKENDSFIDPEFNYHDFIAALPFNKKIVSTYLNHYQKTSFYQMLGQERVKYAAKQLESNPDKPIKNIKLDAGFKSYSSFINNFKRVYGITPSEYRSKNLN